MADLRFARYLFLGPVTSPPKQAWAPPSKSEGGRPSEKNLVFAFKSA